MKKYPEEINFIYCGIKFTVSPDIVDDMLIATGVSVNQEDDNTRYYEEGYTFEELMKNIRETIEFKKFLAEE